MRPWLSPLILLLVLAAPRGAPAQEDDVTIYRCVSSDGSLSIGNTPCGDDATTEQVRTMLRPQDAPPRERAARPAAPSEPAPARAIERRATTVREPRPMYECVTPEGDRYTSDDGEGNPRWVPLWTLGYPVGGHYPPPGGSPPPTARRGVTFVDDRTRMPPPANLSIPPAGDRPRPSADPAHRPGRPHPGDGYGYGQGGGTWIRDACVRLPQQEVCDRLADRRQEIRRRVFNAQQTERLRLRAEERVIGARLAEDCGIR
ncbi:DUF4124 domain-containing protein [Luteimonas sp. RD2P54]|uniref:DUF4124 domain-containing protein n=1 Tax=Luteimonas endophytica TaxID=3042023 RepID=A0ABT6J5S9_9GAMM|nr:DUF4124 domain-containing protein [Luteimonas endophytica]MDH5821945.1 DUF4124 domain-containing protein [Luteimonas endophytica]